jgi:hypothetical protein
MAVVLMQPRSGQQNEQPRTAITELGKLQTTGSTLAREGARSKQQYCTPISL